MRTFSGQATVPTRQPWPGDPSRAAVERTSRSPGHPAADLPGLTPVAPAPGGAAGGAGVTGAAGATPLVESASTLLDTLAEIRGNRELDPQQLRHFLANEIRTFQSRAQRAMLPVETIVAARYCLCTALDEAAALTPWGGNGVWSAHSLLVAFHNETWGGEKFFQLLGRLITQPQQHRPMLELQYYLLALGYRGRYHVLQNGEAQLDALLRRLRKLLHDTGPGYTPPLSNRWAVVQGERSRAPHRWLPLWTWLLLACVGAGLGFGAFLLATSSRAHRTLAAINEIHLPELVTDLSVDLQKLLRPEIEAGTIVVRSEADRTVIAIRGDGLFESGQAAVNPAYLAVLGRIASILNRVPGNVVIAGFTDNQPIRDRRFASNDDLSQARAVAVARAFVTAGFDRMRNLTVVGRGEAEPVASNASAAGRARNRRVEIMLLTPNGQRAIATGAPR